MEAPQCVQLLELGSIWDMWLLRVQVKLRDLAFVNGDIENLVFSLHSLHEYGRGEKSSTNRAKSEFLIEEGSADISSGVLGF